MHQEQPNARADSCATSPNSSVQRGKSEDVSNQLTHRQQEDSSVQRRTDDQPNSSGSPGTPHFPVAISAVSATQEDIVATNRRRTSPPLLDVAVAWRTARAAFAWEFRTFFQRPSSYLLLLAATLTATWAFSWLITLLSRGTAIPVRTADDPVAQFLGPNLFLVGGCTLLIPLLTMNSIADERRRSTWEQLVTAPVSMPAVVAAKFAAAWLLLVVSFIPWVGFALVLRSWNGRMISWHGIPWFDASSLPFDWGSIWGGCAGVVVVGATLTAIGILCSGLCRRPLSAAVLTFGAMGLVLLMAFLPRLLERWNFSAAQLELIEAVSCWGHFARFSRGTIEPSLVTGHVTATILLLWLTTSVCRRNEGN